MEGGVRSQIIWGRLGDLGGVVARNFPCEESELFLPLFSHYRKFPKK